MDGAAQALVGDYIRSLRHQNYLVTETNAQTIGWDSSFQYPPYDGQIRLDVYTHISSGANMVEYWHWSSIPSGQEVYWKGVLGHDLEPNRVYAEVSRTAHELQKIGPQLVEHEDHQPGRDPLQHRLLERPQRHALRAPASGGLAL